jgi:hypothetical protein
MGQSGRGAADLDLPRLAAPTPVTSGDRADDDEP